jgi:DNA-binding MarR family transcriptional regulator
MDSFRRIVHALRSSHRAAGDLDLTGAQLFVLATLGTAVGPLGVKELAERTRTDQSTVSVVVGRLVDRGLVKRVRATVDTRRVELSLTARGRALQRKTPATVAQEKLADALGQLASSDAATLSRLLKSIVEMMGEADAPAPMLFDESTPGNRPRNSAPGFARRTPQRRAAAQSAHARAVRR